MSMLRDELLSLLSSSREEFDRVKAVKSALDRIDSLTRFCRQMLRDSSLCVVDDCVRYYDGRVYASVTMDAVRGILGNLLMDEGASPTDVRKMGDMPLSVIVEKRRERSDALAFQNCIYDLEVGIDRPFSPLWVVTELLPYSFDDSARCPRFGRFLREVLPDEDEQNALMEFFSLAYVDRTKVSVEKMALFIGSGANGKSVVFEVIKAVLGEDAVSVLDPTQLADEKMLPYLKGKRLNFSPDVRRSAAFESALKALASGQKVTGRRIFCDAEQISAPPLAFAFNEMPPLRDTTDAFFRRLLIFPFDVVIPEEKQDKGLAAAIIRDELPGIFNWLMLCRISLKERGYEFAPSVKMRARLDALRSEWRSDVSPVRAYLSRRGLSPFPMYPGQECVPITQNEIVLGLRGMVSAAAITKELAGYGVKVVRTRESRSYRVFQIQK